MKRDSNGAVARCAGLLLVLVMAAACGQKAGVGGDNAAAPAPDRSTVQTGPADVGTDPAAGAAAPTPETTAAPTPATAAPAAGTKPATTATTRARQATPSGGTTATTARTQGAAGAGGGSTATTAAPQGRAAASVPGAPVDRTGVSDQKIRIGIHAPITGAAPFPQDAFDKGKDVYWKHVAEKGGIFGRNVEVVFRDDQFNPSHAVQVCREMVEQEKVFLLIGAAGSEQITACAGYANSAGVPYLSAGVNEEGLAGLRTYFATSQTYNQQNPLLIQLVANRLHKTKIAIVINNTPALNEALESVTREAQAAGLSIMRSSRIGKNATDSELLSEAAALRSSGAEVVYILTSPVNFIKLATNAQAQAYNPIYIGPGITNGINIVAEAGCPAIGAAKFLSPFPELDVIDKLDPDYQKSYQKYNGAKGDDIGIAEWGINKVVGAMLEAAGQDLSRQSFIAGMESGKEFNTNVYPTVSYSGVIRFGAKSAHLLEADCTSRTYKTVATFATGF